MSERGNGTGERGRDFVVVGAGPAGARAAELLARRGFDVLLLDPRAPWEKPCGGGLTAAALVNTPDLRELDDEAEVIREIQAVAPSGVSVVVPLRKPYHVVRRRALSRWGLDRAVSAGAEFLPVAARSVERDAGGWKIVDDAGETHHAHWLVAADGSASPLRRRLAPRLEPELAPLRVAYTSDGAPPGRAVFRMLPGVDGYLWDFPRIGHHSVGVGVPPRTFGRSDLDGAIDLFRLAETGETAPVDSGGAVLATSLWSSGSFEDLGGRDFALLGDAAGLADAATGEGIDYALRSAALAAAAFEPEVGFDRYPGAARDAFEKEIRRARRIREAAYGGRNVERLVRWAERSRRWATVLACLADAVNEHGSPGRAVLRGLFGPWIPAVRAKAVPCDRTVSVGSEAEPCCESGLRVASDDDASWRQRLEVPASWAGAAEWGRTARETIASIPGVTRTAENRLTRSVVLEMDPDRAPFGEALGVLRVLDEKVDRGPVRWHLRLGRTGCARCAAKFRASAGSVRGVLGVVVDRTARRITLEIRPADLDEAALAEVLEAEGLSGAVRGRATERRTA